MSAAEATLFVYRHIWEIADEDLAISSLKVEASKQLGPILGQLGVRPTARPRFDVSDDLKLVAEVPVLRLAGIAPVDDVDEAEVRRLIAAGQPDGHIAAQLGVPRSAVEEIRGQLESAAAGSAGAVA